MIPLNYRAKKREPFIWALVEPDTQRNPAELTDMPLPSRLHTANSCVETS